MDLIPNDNKYINLYSWLNIMDRRKTYSQPWCLEKNVILIGLSYAMMVISFLSGISLSIFLPLNPALYKIVNAPNIQCPRCKEQDES